jgi:hypothetical protein
MVKPVSNPLNGLNYALAPKPSKVTGLNPNGSFHPLLFVRKTKRCRVATVMDKMATTVVFRNTVYEVI